MKVCNILNTLRTPLWPQWLAAAEVFLLSMMVGMNTGWTTPFLGKLTKPNPPFEVTDEQIVWVASVVNLSRSFGVILGSVLTCLGGSKLPLYICGLYFTISWTCLVCANTIEVVFVSLVCNGVSQGTFSTIYPLYIGEIAHPKVRGKLVSFIVQGMMTGNLLGNIIGTYLAPWVFAAINLVPSFVFVVTFSFFPQTPHYLIRSEKIKDAAHSIQWYNRKADVPSELKCLSDFLIDNPSLSFFKALRKLNTPVNRRALFMMNVVYSLFQLTGVSTIQSYMEVLFTKARVNVISPSSLVITLGVINIISCWAAVYIIGKFGRTTLLLATCIVLSVGIFGWGLNYHLLDIGFDEPNLQWLTIVFSILYRISLVIGAAPVVPTMLSEIFAPDVKNLALCICNITNAFCSFISNKSFQLLIDQMTLKYVFYLFAVITILLGIYSIVVIPETKGKTLAEIQVMMNRRQQEKLSEVTRV